jgi:hypothetical protein
VRSREGVELADDRLKFGIRPRNQAGRPRLVIEASRVLH